METQTNTHTKGKVDKIQPLCHCLTVSTAHHLCGEEVMGNVLQICRTPGFNNFPTSYGCTNVGTEHAPIHK